MSFVVKDNIKYNRYDFSGKESVFEKIVFSQIKHLFGKNVILFSKKKIRTINGIGTIPDGFLIDFESKTWFLIEVEISNHDVYTHVVPQITKFSSALKNVETRKQLINSFEKEIDDDFFNKALLNSIGINDIFKTLTGIIEKKPKVVIILEQEHKELSLVIEDLPFETLISVFEIFYREKHELEEDGIYKINPPFSIGVKDDFLKIQNKVTEVIQLNTYETDNEFDNLDDKIMSKSSKSLDMENKSNASEEEVLKEILECINRISRGEKHTKVFKEIASRKNKNSSTVADAFTRRLLKLKSIQDTLNVIKDKSIFDLLLKEYANYEGLIRRELLDFKKT